MHVSYEKLKMLIRIVNKSIFAVRIVNKSAFERFIWSIIMAFNGRPVAREM